MSDTKRNAIWPKQWAHYDGLPPITYTFPRRTKKAAPYAWIPLPAKKRNGKHYVAVKGFDGKGGEMIVKYTITLCAQEKEKRK